MPARKDVQTPLYYGGEDIKNAYAFMSGVCVLPLAEEPPTDEFELETWSPVVIARLHAPYRIRRVVYDVEKQNTPPVIPTPGVDAGKFVFVGGALGIHPVQNQTFTMWDWKVAAEYVYVEDCVSRPEDGFVLGTPPWEWQSTLEAVLPPGTPTIGAISQAGTEPRMGYTAGETIDTEDGMNPYFYSFPSYLPGAFLNDSLINGGEYQTP